MIYGYYCIYPEKIGECPEIRHSEEEIERLRKQGAPAAVIEGERRACEGLKAEHTGAGRFRERVESLYAQGREDAVLANYGTVFGDAGFDPAEAYGEHAALFDGADYLKPVIGMTDGETVAFLKHVSGKFEAYGEKHRKTFEWIRGLFIRLFELHVADGTYPGPAAGCIARLREIAVEVDDGFGTALCGASGYYEARRNTAAVSARQFGSDDAFTLFHEMSHATAGSSGGACGFMRLEGFFGSAHKSAYELMNEAFANARAIQLLGAIGLPAWMEQERGRDLKVELIVRLGGRLCIDRDLYYRAYFSDDIKDVERLAAAVEASFGDAAPFGDLSSIKNALFPGELICEGMSEKEAAGFRGRHKHSCIDGLYQYYRAGSPRLREQGLGGGGKTAELRQALGGV